MTVALNIPPSCSFRQLKKTKTRFKHSPNSLSISKNRASFTRRPTTVAKNNGKVLPILFAVLAVTSIITPPSSFPPNSLSISTNRASFTCRATTIAALSTAGLSHTVTRLRNHGKVLSILSAMVAVTITPPSSFLQLKKTKTLFQHSPNSLSISINQASRFRTKTWATLSTGALSKTFTRLKNNGQVALIPYIMAGDPDLSTTAEALKLLDSCGSDIIEVGVPYSDPLADGPVIQAAATRALARGANFNAIFSMLQEVIPQISCPIVLFTYYNPILKRGIDKFMVAVKDVGVHGLIVPDVPWEETGTLSAEAVKNGIELVLLTTPTTPIDRMKAIAEASEGFVYLVSSTGVTGARESVSGRVQTLLQRVKEATSKPVAVGFGISQPEHVKQVVGWGADGVIVGSAMVKLLGEAKFPEEGLKELENFTKSLKSALP